MREKNISNSDLKTPASQKEHNKRRNRDKSLSTSAHTESSDLSSECDNAPKKITKHKKISKSHAFNQKRAGKSDKILENINIVTSPINKVFEIVFFSLTEVLIFTL